MSETPQGEETEPSKSSREHRTHQSGSQLADGKQVRNLRKAKGLTQKQLADKADVTRELVGLMERGGYHSSRVADIARALEVPTERLLVGWTEPKAELTATARPELSIGAYLSRLPTTIGPLFGRQKAIGRMDGAWESPDKAAICLEAEGGAGKTALASHWLTTVTARQPKLRIYDYSFNSDEFSANPSAQAMLNHAYAAFDLGDPSGINEEQKVAAIASAVMQSPTVFTLDGLEALQHPPGHVQEGRIIDPWLRALLRRLAQVASRTHFLLLLTSRMRVRDLQQWERGPVVRMELPGVDRAAAKEILALYHVKGRDRDVLSPIRRYTRGHPLTLHLLAGYIEDRFQGDGRAWAEHGELATVPRAGADAIWVMELYERWFETEPVKLQLLRLVSLFDGHVSRSDIDALLQDGTPGLTDKLQKISDRERKTLIAQLLRARLLLSDDPLGGVVDMHVIVRDYFRSSLQKSHPAMWKRGNASLAKFFSDQVEGDATTPDDVRILYNAIKHACRAGEYAEAYRLYDGKVHGTTDHVVRSFGLFGDDLSTLYAFFDLETGEPTTKLPMSARLTLTERAATRLRWVGRLGDSIRKMKWILSQRRIPTSNVENAIVASRYVPECRLMRGELRAAETDARVAIRLANEKGSWIDRTAALTIHAAAKHQLGLMNDAEKRFQEAEAIQVNEFPTQPILNSVRAHRYHELLLDLGRYSEVQVRSERLLEPLQRERVHALDLGPVDEGCAFLSLGLARLRARSATADVIQSDLNHALTRLSDSGRREFIYQAQLAKAEEAIARHEFAEAIRLLRAVRYECEQDEMARLVVDADLLLGAALAHHGAREEASVVLKRAINLTKSFHYGRRREQLSSLAIDVATRLLKAPPILRN